MTKLTIIIKNEKIVEKFEAEWPTVQGSVGATAPRYSGDLWVKEREKERKPVFSVIEFAPNRSRCFGERRSQCNS